MSWRAKEPEHQQSWYLLCWAESIRSTHVKGWLRGVLIHTQSEINSVSELGPKNHWKAIYEEQCLASALSIGYAKPTGWPRREQWHFIRHKSMFLGMTRTKDNLLFKVGSDSTTNISWNSYCPTINTHIQSYILYSNTHTRTHTHIHTCSLK